MGVGQQSEQRLPLRRTPFLMNSWRVEPDRNRIIGEAGEALLEPKIMDVLSVLAAQPGTVLSREDIIDTVWGRSFGADESLTRSISLLRKTFSNAGTPMIETIARRGYRLVATVSPAGVDSPALATPVHRRMALRIILVFVAAALLIVAGVRLWPSSRTSAEIDGLPITLQVSPGDRIAKNVAASLGDALARAPLLRVHSNASASRTGYRVALTSMIERDQTAIRLQLSTGAEGTLLWSTTVGDSGKGWTDPASTHAIAGQLVGRILVVTKRALRKQPVAELRPWQLVLLATWVPGDDEVFLSPHRPDAFYLQRRALNLDPHYAPAHASLASGLAYHAMFDPAADTPQRQREAALHAQQAQALAPYDAGVLYELATYRRLVGDRDNALAMLRRVVQLQPDHPLAASDAVFVAALCRPSAGLAFAQLRATLASTAPDDPIQWVLQSHMADLALGSGDWAGAARAAAASRQIVHQTWSGITLAAALAASGRSEEARRVAHETKLEWPRLDWRAFAQRKAGAWCLGGSSTAARNSFSEVAD